MELLSIGTTDIKVTSIMMGTWQADRKMWTGVDDTEIIGAIRAAFEAGITAYDTAEGYGNGHSERLLGETLADVRDQVVYATKVSPNHLGYHKVVKACHRSLKNLKTDVIDLYQIHWPSGFWGGKMVPIAETMEAMNTLKKEGKIRAIGASNFNRTQLEEAARYGRIDSLQPPYSLFWRHVERDAMPYCLENKITILGYAPMAQGLLTGKFDTDHTFGKKDIRFRNRLFKPENREAVQEALARLRPLADRHGVSPGQLALAWVIAHPATCAIAGARNAEQILENAKAAEIFLPDADLAELNAIGRLVTDHLDDNPVMWT